MPDQILPFYVVCDQSYSMTDHLDALNDGLAELHRAVSTDPVVADKTRFCLIGFSGTAEILQPLCHLSDVVKIVELTPQAETSFGTVFTLLRETIEKDVDVLTAAAYRVYRPVVFFLSDGQPTDPVTWPDAYGRLRDREWPPRPNIIAFGIGDANAATMSRIGTSQSFMSTGGVSPGAALHGFARALTTSVICSGGITAEGDLVFQVSDRVPGFTPLQIDPVL
jgi:uncharacterized protein YegL